MLVCKFEKAKSYFNDIWVGLVKNGHCHLVHETLKSAEWVYGLSLFFACWLWCNNFWLDRLTLHFLSLNFKYYSIRVVLVSPLTVAGMIQWNRVCLSFHPDICQGLFLEFDHEISLNFAMVLETLMKLFMTARFCGKTFLLQKVGKSAKNSFS